MERLLLKPVEAADAIGVCRAQIYKMLAQDELPGVMHIGRSIRISSEALRGWVREKAGLPANTEHLRG